MQNKLTQLNFNEFFVVVSVLPCGQLLLYYAGGVSK